MRSSLTLAVGLSLTVLLSGCPSSSPRAEEPAPDGLSCGRRLVGGMWRFTGFTPFAATDPAVLQDIAAVHGALRLGFDGQTALTEAPGVRHVGPYRIDRDGPYACSVVAPDDTGFVSQTDVRFLDANTIEVVDQRSQTPGRAVMVRVPVGQ